MIAMASLLCMTVSPASAQQAPPDKGASGTKAGKDRSGTDSAESWDANHDGVYTCDEWKSYLGRIFDRADRNHDGNLTPAEFEGVRKASKDLADADFGYFDENQDGKITRTEFVGKPNVFILEHDKNGDCRVTPEELKGGDSEQKPPGAKGKKF
jgi:Ca2+-binding EF-hand superfamily protein